MKFVRLLFIVAIVTINLVTNLQAQNIQIPQNALLKQLLRDSISVGHISISKTPIIPQPIEFSQNFQQLIKYHNSLFILIDGTGRVFKATKWNEKEVQFTRVDSTYYFGYNKGSRKLIINDTIFSFGGYGFWHFNGCLSFLTPHREWEMIQLNKEIPYYNINDLISSIANFDEINKELFFSAAPIIQQTVLNGIENDSFYVLNIANRNIKTLGKNIFTKSIFEKFIITKKVETPYGILFDDPLNDNRDFILNIKNNQIYTSNHRILQSLITSSAYALENVLFYKKGNLYVSTPPFDKVDSIKFDITQFKLDSAKLYEVENNRSLYKLNKNLFNIILFSSSIVVLFLFVIVIFFKMKKRKTKIKIEPGIQNDEILTPLEKQLLKDFITLIESKGNCSTDELNNLLGVGFKTNEIKKKARTDFVTKVNLKLMNYFQTQKDVIIRERSEIDKRSFLYSLEIKIINEIKKLLLY